MNADFDGHPALSTWNSQPGFAQERALAWAEKLAGRVEIFGNASDRPLTDWDSWLLRHSILDVFALASVGEDNQQLTESQADARAEHLRLATTNTVRKCVPIVRDAINYEKENGIAAIAVRAGLRLPIEWSEGYDEIYNSGLPWMLSHVLQSAFMGSPELGEQHPWNSE